MKGRRLSRPDGWLYAEMVYMSQTVTHAGTGPITVTSLISTLHLPLHHGTNPLNFFSNYINAACMYHSPHHRSTGQNQFLIYESQQA